MSVPVTYEASQSHLISTTWKLHMNISLKIFVTPRRAVSGSCTLFPESASGCTHYNWFHVNSMGRTALV